MTNSILRELALVLPVYNEEACIAHVVSAWRDELNRHHIDFVMLILNDGSQDRTREQLEQFTEDQRILIHNKPNSGHGPTILCGYQMAVAAAEWVFQTDSDNEISPAHFLKFWENRTCYDGLFGVRVGRLQGQGRKFISKVSRITLHALFGGGVLDANVPYRLIRSSILRPILARIPDNTFAPNIIISGALAAGRARIFNYPVVNEGRTTGAPSIVKWKLWKSAVKSFMQTVRYRFT